MSNTLSIIRGVCAIQAENKKAWSNVFMASGGNYASLSNDKKGIKGYIDIKSNRMVKIEIEGRNKRGKQITKCITVAAYENPINNAITRLLGMIANDVSK